MQFTVFLNITRSRTVALFFFVLVSSGSSHSESSFTESNASGDESSELIGRRVRDQTIMDEHSHNSTFEEDSILGNTVLSPVASDEERGIRSGMGLEGLMCGDSP